MDDFEIKALCRRIKMSDWRRRRKKMLEGGGGEEVWCV